MLFKEGSEIRAADFLFALEKENHVDRKVSVFLEGLFNP
jgi:hypothetical protein